MLGNFFFFLLNTFQILQITAIENEINNRTDPAPFVKFVGQPNTEISSQAMTAITWTQKMQSIKFNNFNNSHSI